MLTDIYRWLLNRFEIKFTAKEMIIKEGICVVGGICGEITQHLGRNIVNEQEMGFRRSLTILVEKNVIDKQLKKDLERIWGQRNKLHLSTVRMREFETYDLNKYNEAIRIWIDFKKSLQIARNREII